MRSHLSIFLLTSGDQLASVKICALQFPQTAFFLSCSEASRAKSEGASFISYECGEFFLLFELRKRPSIAPPLSDDAASRYIYEGAPPSGSPALGVVDLLLTADHSLCEL